MDVWMSGRDQDVWTLRRPDVHTFRLLDVQASRHPDISMGLKLNGYENDGKRHTKEGVMLSEKDRSF